ncbi:MAG TPA: bacterioferritin [Candidatus Polarisedimenticolia bacterium]|nr:bacterioferritin [Candidatus Polarisedimenticolia bacterium]
MKGSPEIVKQLNEALRGELAAINQYFLHASMFKNWGYLGLYKKVYAESIEEMKHAEKLIDRVLFLEGTPSMSGSFKIRVGKDVKEMLENDLSLEREGLPELKKAIALCLEHGDAVTRELLEHLLVAAEGHVQWLESQTLILQQVGIENYLAQHIQAD